MTPSLGERVSERVSRLRRQRPAVDHAVRAGLHYVDRDGNAQAGAVTYFGFLSFFPILAMAFFVVGLISHVYPELREQVALTVEEVLPGVIGTDDGQIPLQTFEERAGTIGWLAGIGLVYTGLGWLSALRRALEVMFGLPKQERPGFVVGKVGDLASLVVLGLVLLVSISLSSLMTWFSEVVLGWLDVDGSRAARLLLQVLTHGLAVGATTLLFVAMFRILARADVAGRALWQGALLGAVGFEALKAVAGVLIAHTQQQPAFRAFGVALILLVWINYFSRLVMLAASWAYTAPAATELRELAEQPVVEADDAELVTPAPAAVAAEDPEGSPRPSE